MSCQHCGAPCQGQRCQGCEQIRVNERVHGTSADGQDDSDDAEEWAVEQTGLDGDAEGQARLDGGVVKPDGGEDA